MTSTNNERVLLWEVVRRDLEVERGRALSDAAGDVVVRAVARAEPASEITCLADRHATQVRADACCSKWLASVTLRPSRKKNHESKRTQHDKPLRLLDPLAVRLRIPQRLPLCVLGLLDLIRGAVAHEDGLAAPLDDDVFALGDGGQVDFDFSLREDVL